MDREKVAFAAMKPVDLVLAAAVKGLRATGTLEPTSEGFYRLAKKALSGLYERQNDLQAEGLDLVPATGGVIFAANHQSWNDVQVLGATCPRRVRFLAKSEFETWPILRHLIALSDSPFIRRGGDTEGMAQAVEWLQQGKALAIFPEGTIPGEEDKMRHDVEPKTGLLRGHTGAVRLAIAAGVPIVPVGVSGTGASFPPEVYPRLELLHGPKKVPVTVRYGKPIYYEGLRSDNATREQFREHTNELMLAISGLVDHSSNYVPLEVPIQPLPQYKKVGVLLLHGFTSSVRTVDGLLPHLKAANIPFRMPVLRGHGTQFTDLAGVGSEQWFEDAEKAFLELAEETGHVVVVGLSMGGLLALNLALQHPEKTAGVVTWGAALRFHDKLAGLTPLFARFIKTWPSPNSFEDKDCAATNENYQRFTTDSFASLYDYAKETEARLPAFTTPIAILQSKKDKVVDPAAANLIYRDVASRHREIHWFYKSGHEMGQDLEANAVFDKTMDFINRFRKP